MDSRKRFTSLMDPGRVGLAMLGALSLEGCAYLDEMMARTGTPDTRAQLGWRDNIVVSRYDVDEYTCQNPYVMRCVSRGISYECDCMPR